MPVITDSHGREKILMLVITDSHGHEKILMLVITDSHGREKILMPVITDSYDCDTGRVTDCDTVNTCHAREFHQTYNLNLTGTSSSPNSFAAIYCP